MGCQRIPFPPRSHPGESCPPATTLGSPRRTASPATYSRAQVVLARDAKGLGSMETAAHRGDTQNRCQLAPRRLSVVLEVNFTSPAKRRPKADKHGDSGVDFSNGGGESNLGCTAHSWRVVEARLRGLGTNGVTLGATGAETSRPREALADVPEESSGGDRSHGLFHRAHPDLRHSVLLLHH